MNIAGRTILITGASSGIGAHLAQTLAKKGARVVLAARRMDRLEGLVEQITSAGGEALGVEMDVTNAASVTAGFAKACDHFGAVDGVIANAGMNNEGILLNISEEDFRRVFDVNVTGVFLTIAEAARRMIADGSKEREHGRIVIISSITADIIAPGAAAYAASKAAAEHLGRNAAREWARKGISVNVVNPGYIATELTDDWFEAEGGKRQMAGWPRKRLTDIGALDATIELLLSDEARQLTGGTYTVDDGQSLA